MLACPWFSVSLGEAKINDIDIVLLLPNPNKEIVRLYVSMQEMSRVHVLYSLDHLVSEHEHCLQAKFPLAVIEQVFKRRSQ